MHQFPSAAADVSPEAGAVKTTDGQQQAATDKTALEGLPLHDALRVLGVVVAPATLVVSLLYYFGRISTAAQFRFFAVEHSALGLSPTDYLVRSIEPMVKPLVALAAVTLIGISGYSVLLRSLRRPGWRRVLLLLAITLFVFLVLSQSSQLIGLVYSLPPLYLAAALLLLTYGIILGGQILSGSDLNATQIAPPSLAVRSSLALIGLLTLFFVFVAVARYAADYGRTTAQQFEQQLSSQTSVVVYSAKRLSIQANGVDEKPLSDDGAYRYRYRGLRLLAWSNGKYFLLPEGWSSDKVTIVLSESSQLRIELIPGEATNPPPAATLTPQTSTPTTYLPQPAP